MNELYEKPRVERYGEFRELTLLSGWGCYGWLYQSCGDTPPSDINGGGGGGGGSVGGGGNVIERS